MSTGRDLAVGAAAPTCTRRNDAGGSSRNVPRRTCARQFHSNPRLTSLRSATCAKHAPGSSASATILSLSVMLHRRRRSRPVMISILPSSIVLTSALTIALKITSPDHGGEAWLTERLPESCRLRRSASSGPGPKRRLPVESAAARSSSCSQASTMVPVATDSDDRSSGNCATPLASRFADRGWAATEGRAVRSWSARS